MTAPASATGPEETDGVLGEVAPGVWAWTQGDGSWWLNNAGLVAGDDGDVIVDTCATERRTRSFLGSIGTARPGGSIRFAVNTHLHGDHTYGNSLLPGSTCIVGHEQMRVGLAADTIIDGCPPFWAPLPDWGHVTKRLPTLTFADRVVLHSGATEVHVLHPGFPAHTPGDAVVLVPGADVLFTGDLLFHGVTPLVFMGSVEGALRSLDWIAGLDAAVVVPGHGDVVGRDGLDDVLETHRSYYALVLASARAGIAAGRSPLEQARRTDLGDLAGLADAERIVLNLHRAYAELAQRDFDLVAALEDAVLLNDGPLPTAV
ncbi:MAG: MBL fold metallo-hydrolase [Nocardioides alkalitolerans]